MIICIAEDRVSEEFAVKLLLLSLVRHCSDIPVVLTYPPATPAFADWVRRRIPRCELRTTRLSENSGWNIKADALLQLLEDGFSEVWWLDSDVLVDCNFVERYRSVPENTMLICEEALYGAYRDDGIRTRNWNLPIGRRLPFSLNTGVLRVSRHHLAVLHAWKALLNDERYQSAQKQIWSDRPIHLVGDQDVLTAILSSSAFSEISIHVLRRGRDIIQYFGYPAYTTAERWANIFDVRPAFIHCQGWKPWLALDLKSSVNLRSRLKNLYIALSPYVSIAETYEPDLEEPLPWRQSHDGVVRFFRLIGFGNAALTGLPIAMLVDARRALKSRARPVPRT